MKSTFRKSLDRIKNLEKLAFRRRVMWIDFEERLTKIFSEIEKIEKPEDPLKFYLTFSKNSFECYQHSHIYRFNSLNQAQISSGWHHINVFHSIKLDDPRKPKHTAEGGAAITFSQGIEGKVIIMLFPFNSDIHKIKEDNIIIGYGINPNNLNERKIRKYLRVFFNYCEATSIISGNNYKSYFFRCWIKFHDIRNKKIQNNSAFVLIERIILAFGGIAATLYTSTKWPFF